MLVAAGRSASPGGAAGGALRPRARRVRPSIGQNQGIQHPLAKCWAELEAANLMVMKAAWLYDEGASCGSEANGANIWPEAGTRLRAGGDDMAGWGMRRVSRRALPARGAIPRIAPVSPQLIPSYLAERVLDLPKSY